MYPSEPQRSSGDLNFPLFGFPVRIHPLFWLVTAAMGMRSRDLKELLAWVLAIFLAILVHELGHAFVMRSFGFHPWITLYGFGGLTSRSAGGYNRGRGESSLAQITISAAGPAAGFLLAIAVVFLLSATGHEVSIELLGGVVPNVEFSQVGSLPLTLFVYHLLQVSIIWGIVNLLPIYPMDGGQIMREIIMRLNQREGLQISLVISLVTAGAMALVSFFRFNDTFMGIFFLYLAFISYTSLGGMMGRR